VIASAAMAAETVRSGVALHGSYDVEAEVRSVPEGYLVKGMFFDRLLVVLGSDFQALRSKLVKPPDRGKYVGFRDYPGADFVRLVAAAGRKAYPRVGLREAIRLLAHDDFKVFADSMVGKVTLAVVSDARSILRKVPFIYRSLAPGAWDISAEELDERTMRLEFRPFFGRWEYAAGQFESAILHFGPRSVIHVAELGDGHVRFDVEHAPLAEPTQSPRQGRRAETG
jgi:uncharacterized protein (TIGR02265 family)